jgi:hypothetical protein
MSYLNITKTRLEERFFYRKNRIKEEIKERMLKIHADQFSFSTGVLIISLAGAIACGAILGGFDLKDEDKIIYDICYFGVYACLMLSVMAVTRSTMLSFRDDKIKNDEIGPESSYYKKAYKQICDKYEISELESNNAIGYILAKKLKDDLIYNKANVSFYQYLYENKALKEEEMKKIKDFLKANNKSFSEYVIAINSEILIHILAPYKEEMAKEIDNVIVNFLKEMEEEEQRAIEEEQRVIKEQNRVKELENKKRTLFTSNSNTLASSMLGKNIAVQVR